MPSATNQEVVAAVKNLEATAAKCGMDWETLLNTFWDMGNECRRNEGDGALESVEAVISEFGDMVWDECREIGITERVGYHTALNAFCIGYLTK